MGLLAPIVLGIIKRKLFGGGGFSQNASGLLGMLNGQKDHVQAAMPNGFADQLKSSGFMDQIASVGGSAVDSVGNAAGNVASGVGNVASDAAAGAGAAASSGGSFLKKILPIAVLLAIAVLGWRFLTGNKSPDMDKMADSASSTVAATTDAAKDAMPSIQVGDTDVGAAFGDIFSSATDTVSGITDVDSATAAIPAFEGITGKVDGLSGMWDKVPEAGRGQLGGIVTDGLGKLTPALDKVGEIPGVSDVLGPITGPLLEKLQAFTQ